MVQRLVSLLAPPLCAACRDPLPRDGPALCPGCASRLPWIRDGCPRCALPGHPGRPCPAAGAAFDRAWAPLVYAGPAAGIVRALKFQRLAPLADTMAAAIAAGLPRELSGLPIVPVPPQRARARARGFDPAGLVARRVAARTGAPLVACLRRTDRGGRHTPLGRRERRLLAPVVEAAGPVPPVVLLLDDVHTTGATLDGCARALKAGGADRVAAVTYARTRRDQTGAGSS